MDINWLLRVRSYTQAKWITRAYECYYREGLESVFILQNNSLVPYFIDELRVDSKGKSLLKLEEVDSFEEAENFCSAKLYLPLDMLPPLKNGAFYYHDIISY